MAEPIVWEDLPKSQADDTTIDEAISDALDVHNADSEAHMAALGSLELHRENEVIDHPAESVPNDKLKPVVRGYIAIVDPSTEWDYDTIASAVAYANANGGGRILIRAGDHYVTDDLDVNSNIFLVGEVPGSTNVHLGSTDNGWIRFTATGFSTYGDFGIENLTIDNLGGTCFRASAGSGWGGSGFIVRNCQFSGGGIYVESTSSNMSIYDCEFEMTTTISVKKTGRLYLERCQFIGEGNSLRAIGNYSGSTSQLVVDMVDCEFLNNNETTFIPLYGNVASSRWRGVEMYPADLHTYGMQFSDINGCALIFASTSHLRLINGSNIITGCRLEGSSGNNVRMASGVNNNVIATNIIDNGVTNSGTNNQVTANVIT